MALAIIWRIGAGSACGQAVDQPAAILRTPETAAALAYQFSAADNALLDEIQRGCFNYFWNEVGNPVPIVKDRLSNDRVSSLGGVGFQFSSIPIGVERGWITRDEGEQRALAMLRPLIARTDNKKFGVYLHFVDPDNGGMHFAHGPQVQAATVDHALFQSGAMTAASYFGGEVAELVDTIVGDANWRAFQMDPEGFISFGWRTENMVPNIDGPGFFRPYTWRTSSSEERLVYFLAVGAPREAHAVEPELYYRLKRTVKRHQEMPPFVVSWGGSAFTYFFDHCWINYRELGPDDPSAFGVAAPRVDWFENSRRALVTHRQRCIEASALYKSFGPDSWGLSPAAGIDAKGEVTYIVPALRPSQEDKDIFCEGTVAPYAAGSSIMFLPELSLRALRHFRHLRDGQGNYVVWRSPEEGGYGLLDSFNLDRKAEPGTPDYISIDEGPLLLAIENARTGLIWKLFMSHPAAKLAVERLRLKPANLRAGRP